MTAALLTVFCTGILLIYAYLTLITVPNQSENAFQTQSIYTKFPPRQILAENQNPEKLNSPAQTSKRKPPDLLKTRGRTVRQKCYAENRRHGIHLNRTINRQDLVWQMIIEPKSEIFGCVPLRSSSGTWNRFWYQIRGHSTHEEFNFEQRKELTTVVQNFSIKQIRETINTGYRVVLQKCHENSQNGIKTGLNLKPLPKLDHVETFSGKNRNFQNLFPGFFGRTRRAARQS